MAKAQFDMRTIAGNERATQVVDTCYKKLMEKTAKERYDWLVSHGWERIGRTDRTQFEEMGEGRSREINVGVTIRWAWPANRDQSVRLHRIDNQTTAIKRQLWWNLEDQGYLIRGK